MGFFDLKEKKSLINKLSVITKFDLFFEDRQKRVCRTQNFKIWSRLLFLFYYCLHKKAASCASMVKNQLLLHTNFVLHVSTWNYGETIKTKCKYYKRSYTQYPIIRNGLIRNSADFLWKFKKRALGMSNLRDASKNLRNGQCSDFQS